MPNRRKGDDPRAELWGWGSTMGTTVQTGAAGLAEAFRGRFQSCCFIFWQGYGQIFLASSLLCVLPAKISPDYLHQAFTKCLKGQIQASWNKGQGEPPLLRARVNTGLTISSQTTALGSCLPPLAPAQGLLKPKRDVARIPTILTGEGSCSHTVTTTHFINKYIRTVTFPYVCHKYY